MPIVDAVLRINDPACKSRSSTERITLYEYSGSIDALNQINQNGSGIYRELGSGIRYANQDVTIPDDCEQGGLEIDFYRSNLYKLERQRGDYFAFGAALTTLDRDQNNEYIKGYGSPSDFQLILTLDNRGTLEIETLTDPFGSPQQFSFEASPDLLNPQSFAMRGGDTKTVKDITAGVYSIEPPELPEGWEVAEETCTNGSPDEIVIVGGETTTCTFDYRYAVGSLTVASNVEPNHLSPVWEVDVSGSTPFTATLSGDDSTEKILVDPSFYTIQYDPGPGVVADEYSTTWQCRKNGAVIGSGSGLATIPILRLHDVVCTYTSKRKQAALQIRHEITPEEDASSSMWTVDVDGPSVHSGPLDGSGAEATLEVFTGAYQASLTPLGGNSLSNYDTTWACTANDQPFTNGSGAALSVAVNEGEFVTCTFNSVHKMGRLSVFKNTEPNDESERWVFDFQGRYRYQTLDLSDESYDYDVRIGDYAITERPYDDEEFANYNTSWSCTVDGAPGPSGYGITADPIPVGEGEDVVCTFVNQHKMGTLQIINDVTPDDNTIWAIDVAGRTPFTATLGDGGSTPVEPVRIGSYTLSEAAMGDTYLEDYDPVWACTVDGVPGPSGSGPSLALNIGEGDDVVCTITNTKFSKLRIANRTSAINAPFFSFNSVHGQFPLIHAETKTIVGLFAEPVRVTEFLPSNWDLVVDCGDDPASPVVDGSQVGVDVPIITGQEIECEFQNTLQGGTSTFVLEQTAEPPDVSFFYDEDLFTEFFFALALQNTQAITISDLMPGNYTVTQIENPEYPLTSLSCIDSDGGTLASGATALVELDAGETVICRYENVRPGSITVRTELLGEESTSGESPEFRSTVDNAGLEMGWNTEHFYIEVPPGEYDIIELDTGVDYRFVEVNCVEDGAQNSSVTANNPWAILTLDAGENITCTFVNKRVKATLMIHKDVQPDAPETTWQFDIEGPSPNADAIFGDGDGMLHTIAPGSYTITEVSGDIGTDLNNYNTTWACTGLEASPVTGVGVQAIIDIEDGDVVNCTFTNTERNDLATVIVEKVTVPAGGTGFSFTDTITEPYGFSLDDGMTVEFANVAPGNHFITEDNFANPDYVTADVTCTDPDGGTQVTLTEFETTVNVDADPGEVIRCTFTSLKPGTIVIEKVLLPAEGFEMFSFDQDIDEAFPLDLSGGESREFFNVLPGQYTVSEFDGSFSHALAGIACTDPDGGTTTQGRSALIDLDSGETVHCTFTNARNGSIIVEATSDGPSSDMFTFTDPLDGGDFSIEPDFPMEFFDMPTGVYTITERSPGPAYVLDSIVCNEDGAANTATDLANRTAAITLDPGETVHCTFDNVAAPLGSVTIATTLDGPPGISPVEFSGSLIGGSFGLTPGEARPFLDLQAGTFTVTEADPGPDYVLTGLTCLESIQTNSTINAGTRTVSLVLEAGEDIVCTFAHQGFGRGTIRIEKAVSGPESFDSFEFAQTIDSNKLWLSAGEGYDYYDVREGSYTVTELANENGFTLQDLSCVEDVNANSTWANATANIELDADETVTCTFVNAQQTASVRVFTDVVPDDPSSAWIIDLTAGSLSENFPLSGDGDTGVVIAPIQGPISIIQRAGSGTVLDDYVTTWSCTLDGAAGPAGAGDIIDITLSAEQALVCTFTNTQPDGNGTIIITKESLPAGGNGFEFSQNIDGLDPFLLADGESRTFEGVAPGVYTVAELIPDPFLEPDYLFSTLACEDQYGALTTTVDATATIRLDPGETVRCTFVNAKPGTIEFEAVVRPNGEYVSATLSQDIDEYGDTILGSGTPLIYSRVQTGIYHVSLLPESLIDFNFVGLTCDDVESSINVANGSVIIHLDPAETVRCVYEFAKRGRINVENFTGQVDFDTMFEFTSTIYNDTFPLQANDQAWFDGIAAGSYRVAASSNDGGYIVNGITCQEDQVANSTSDLQTATANIELDPGEIVTCTFANAQAALLTVSADVWPADDGVSRWIMDVAGPSGFTYNATLGHGDEDTRAVPVGSVVITQRGGANTDPLLYITSWQCTVDGQPGPGGVDSTAEFTAAAGQQIDCTFSNEYDPGQLELILDIDPNEPAAEWTFDVAGTSTTLHETLIGDGTTGPLVAPKDDYTVSLRGGNGVNSAAHHATTTCVRDGGPSGAQFGKSFRTSFNDRIFGEIVCTTTLFPRFAFDDGANGQPGQEIIVDVLANDSSAYGPLDPSSVFLLLDDDPHGEISIDFATGAIHFTPTVDFRGVEALTYKVSNGVREDRAVAYITVSNEVAAEPPVMKEVDPGVEETIDFVNPEKPARTTQVEIPRGTLAGPATLVFQELPSGTSAGYAVGGRRFTLDLVVDGQVQENVQFSQPVSLTLTYDEADLLPDQVESELELFYYDEAMQEWLSDGLTLISRDTENNRLVYQIDHLTEFGFGAPADPLAVSLGWFLAERSGDVVSFRWQTATETGTAGFNLLAVAESDRIRLNGDLIPSSVIDSVEPTDYEYAAATDAIRFYLQEIKVGGGASEHGPFDLGTAYGNHTGSVDIEDMQSLWLPMIVR